MNNRLKLVRKKLGLSQKDFGSKLGITGGAVSKLESGQNNLTEQTIALTCTSYNVNYQWLVNGVGEMFADDDSDAQAIVDSVMTGDNEFAKSILVKFARMSEKHWEQLKEIMESMMEE